MTTRDVQAATVAEKDAVFAILTLAFSSDPATRWTWPEPKAYIEAFPHFAKAFGGAAFEKGSALRVGSAGAALWLPPGAGPDEAAMGAMMQERPMPRLPSTAAQLMQQMASYHPKEPHWYLPLLGVDPAHQDKGVGGALLRHVTDNCDRDGVARLSRNRPIRGTSRYTSGMASRSWAAPSPAARP